MKKLFRKMIALCLVIVLALPVGVSTDKFITSKAVSYGVSNPSTDSDGVTTWDCIWFGNYWQSDTNGDGTADQGDSKKPIKWRVLSVNGSDALLLADKNLDVQRYNDEYVDVTWETCTMRSWLNSKFYNNAFSSSEKLAIKTTTVVNDDNPYYRTEGGNNTMDKVYLLSIGEVMTPSYGFTSKIYVTDTRKALNTAYVADGGEIGASGTRMEGNSDAWWLRSSGSKSWLAAYVDYSGYICGNSGNYVGSVIDESGTVRPALHINLSSSSWSYAGIVNSDGEESGTSANVTNSNSSSGSNTNTNSSKKTVNSTTKKKIKLKAIKLKNKRRKITGKVTKGTKLVVTIYNKKGKKLKKRTIKAKKTKKGRFTLKLGFKIKKGYWVRIKAKKKGYIIKTKIKIIK